MYKNVSNQHIVALFLLFSLSFSVFVSNAQTTAPANGTPPYTDVKSAQLSSLPKTFYSAIHGSLIKAYYAYLQQLLYRCNQQLIHP